MKASVQLLEDIQGLLIYLKHKNGSTPNLKDLIEKKSKDPEIFELIYDDYRQNHQEYLKRFFEGRNRRIEEIYKASLVEIYIQYEKLGETATNEEFEAELKKTSDYYNDLINKLPTKFQELHSFGTVHHLLEQILEASKIANYHVPNPPIIGTVSTESINAGAITLENGEPLIIVQEDFLSFIHLFAKIFVQCLPFGEKGETDNIIIRKDEILQNIKSNPDIIRRFKDFLNGYIEGSPRKSEQYFLPMDSKYILCTYLMMGAELFMVGHELGHILRHHDHTRYKMWCFNNECVSTFEDDNHTKEFEADIIGTHLSMQAMALHGFRADFCYLGIECFFIIHDIALKAKKIVSKGHEDISEDFSSHPSNQLRRSKVREELMQIIPKDEIENATYLPDIIEEIMSYLWENSKEIFYAEFQRKTKG